MARRIWDDFNAENTKDAEFPNLGMCVLGGVQGTLAFAVGFAGIELGLVSCEEFGRAAGFVAKTANMVDSPTEFFRQTGAMLVGALSCGIVTKRLMQVKLKPLFSRWSINKNATLHDVEQTAKYRITGAAAAAAGASVFLAAAAAEIIERGLQESQRVPDLSLGSSALETVAFACNLLAGATASLWITYRLMCPAMPQEQAARRSHSPAP